MNRIAALMDEKVRAKHPLLLAKCMDVEAKNSAYANGFDLWGLVCKSMKSIVNARFL